ncbi:MAG: hypothetical protein ACPGO3_05360 [Magnetospiraceae bacterium]
MKRLFLHIGAHKTGTTALQRYLWVNREALVAAGFLYPEAGNIGTQTNTGHHRLARFFFKREWIDKGIPGREWGVLADALAATTCHTALLSSEAFSQLKPEDVQFIAPYLSGWETTVVFYVRPQTELLASSYSQVVKAGYVKGGIEAHFAVHQDRFDFQQVIDAWRIFPNIAVRLYRPTATPQDLIHEFRGLVGIPESLRLPPLRGRANPSVNAWGVACLTCLARDETLSDEQKAPYRRFLIDALSGPNPTARALLTHGLARRVADQYAASNAAIFPFLNDADRQAFQARLTAMPPRLKIETILPETILERTAGKIAERNLDEDKLRSILHAGRDELAALAP